MKINGKDFSTSFPADHHQSKSVHVEPRATKPPYATCGCKEWDCHAPRQEAAAPCRIEPRALQGLNAASVQASSTPHEEQRAVMICSEGRLLETRVNRAKKDTVQSSVKIKARLPMSCCSLPGLLVTRQTNSSAALCMVGFTVSWGNSGDTPSSPSHSWAKKKHLPLSLWRG